MMSLGTARRALPLAVGMACAVAAGACYDVDGSPAGPPDASGAVDSAAPPDSAVVMDTSTGPADSGAPDATRTDSGTSDAGATDSGATPACPDVYGEFSIMRAGVGCGDVDPGVAQRIDGDRVGCFATFASTGAVNGTAAVNSAGGFSGASLSLGTAVPTACSGSWAVATSSMSVVCGAGPSRCSITLSRTRP